jgi:hypothetical protein
MPASGNEAHPFSRPPSGNGPSIEDSLRSAESRSLDFPAAERAVYIRAMVKLSQELKAAGRTVEEIKERVPEFARDYPNLFETVTQPGQYDPTNLQTMLAMLDRMGQGSLNHHQATVIVGKR